MTQKQSVIFRYVTRLMLHIPDATIHTLRELMEPGSEKVFASHIAKLSGTAKQFFETEFSSREFNDTKKQVLRRLWGILENQTFERMFSHPRSKLDLFAEMNGGKVILISRDLDLWAYKKGVVLDFSRPGKPTSNAFIESFNGKLRAECLNTHWFLSLDDARLKMEEWRGDYNEVRPHSAIGNKPPISLMNGTGASRPP